MANFSPSPPTIDLREKEIRHVTLWGALGNLLLLIFKLFAGIIGHSAAMIADAVHSLSDFATDVVVLLFVRLAGAIATMPMVMANTRHWAQPSSALHCWVSD